MANLYTNDIYSYFSHLIFTHTGMIYNDSDYYRLDARIKQLMTDLNSPDIGTLIDLLKNNWSLDKKKILINICTNNETYFFRDVKPFKAISQSLYKEFTSNKKTIYLWSCACSTGQEIYSLLMQIQEDHGPQALDRIVIDATDISNRALEIAKKGIYNKAEMSRGLSESLKNKYFQTEDNHFWKIDEKLRKNVRFADFNLIDGHYIRDKYDIIVCRNVLIYQNTEKKQLILEKIFSSLHSPGYLLMGAGESMIGIKTEFKQEQV